MVTSPEQLHNACSPPRREGYPTRGSKRSPPQSTATASIRDLRRRRAGWEVPADAEESESPPPSSKARSGYVADEAARERRRVAEAERQRNWKLLGPVLRIQRWVRRGQSRRNVKRMLTQRQLEHERMFREGAVELIQKHWRGYKCRSTLRRVINRAVLSPPS
eukprot:Hpha_TRINITY_DN5395_c0_g1::TRINITY_DN5395_c0_g1_i1::g.32905::m.32905